MAPVISDSDLLHGYFDGIPPAFICRKAMVTCLSVLTGLEQLVIRFQSPLSRSAKASRPQPPLTRIILTYFGFKGVTGRVLGGARGRNRC